MFNNLYIARGVTHPRLDESGHPSLLGYARDRREGEYLINMTFSLSILLYIYLGFLVVWFAFFMVALYHMFKFGFKNLMTLIMTFIFAAVAVLMLMATSAFISQIDWSAQVTLLDWVKNNNFGI